MNRTCRKRLWLLLVAALASACSQPQLNSERIGRQFGSYGVEILESSGSHRVSNLYSLDEDRKICRTLALVLFDSPLDSRIAEEHEQIVAGGSIGAVFKANGWIIEKVNLHLGTIEVQRGASQIARLMDIPVPDSLAMHIYRFKLEQGIPSVNAATINDGLMNYATIIELHHPDYLSADELEGIYGAFPAENATESELAAIEEQIRLTLMQ